MKHRFIHAMTFSALVLITNLACAQSSPSGQMVLPSVNGASLSAAAFNHRLEMELAGGQKDSPQLRQLIVQDMVNRQLLINEVVRRGMDKKSDVQQQIIKLREDFLIDRLLQDAASDKTFTEADIKAEFDRQVAAIGPADQAKEYALSLIVLAKYEEAKSLIVELQKGSSFESAAQTKSIDPSKTNGGKLGWVLPQALNPIVANVMVNLPKGVVTANPVQTSTGWAVFKVDDTRPYKIPSYDESRERILIALVQRKRADLLEKLRSTAVIKP